MGVGWAEHRESHHFPLLPGETRFARSTLQLHLALPGESSKNRPFPGVSAFSPVFSRFCPATAGTRPFSQGRFPRRNGPVSHFVGICPRKVFFAASLALRRVREAVSAVRGKRLPRREASGRLPFRHVNISVQVTSSIVPLARNLREPAHATLKIESAALAPTGWMPNARSREGKTRSCDRRLGFPARRVRLHVPILQSHVCFTGSHGRELR